MFQWESFNIPINLKRHFITLTSGFQVTIQLAKAIVQSKRSETRKSLEQCEETECQRADTQYIFAMDWIDYADIQSNQTGDTYD